MVSRGRTSRRSRHRPRCAERGGASGNNVAPTAPMGRCGYGQRLPLLVISLTPKSITLTIRSLTRLRSFNSSKTTGPWGESAARHSKLWPVRSSTCSNSRTAALPENCYLIPRPVCLNKIPVFPNKPRANGRSSPKSNVCGMHAASRIVSAGSCKEVDRSIPARGHFPSVKRWLHREAWLGGMSDPACSLGCHFYLRQH